MKKFNGCRGSLKRIAQGVEAMIQYKRCIGGKKINILVDEKLFERERKIFDALFISYTVSYVETIEEQDENYFIYDKKYYF